MKNEEKIMMKRAINIGGQSFERIIAENTFYVDKSLFIEEWWNNKDDITLITRPSRFGKTLNLSMLECFFSNQFADKKELFRHLNIYENKEVMKLQGRFPVIFVTFASVKSSTYDGLINDISVIIRSLFRKHRYLIDNPHITKDHLSYMEAIMNEQWDEDNNQVRPLSESVIKDAIRRLSEIMTFVYGERVILLLDEYDTPMQEAYINGYWDQAVALLRGVFNASLKTNSFLYKAILTGITRISKESIFSDLNNLKIASVTSDKYSDKFGFTENEVKKALKEYMLENEMDKVRYWYDGFNFGKRRDIYNPWSIVNFLDEGKFTNYWTNTSSNALISRLLKEGEAQFKICLESLVKGESIVCSIDEEIVFNQLNKRSGALWSLMVASGYLKITDIEGDGRNAKYTLSLTNMEVRDMVSDMIEEWFSWEGDGDYNGFVSALLRENLKEMNAYMNRLTLSVISSFDSGIKPSEKIPENFYHGFVLGLIVTLQGRYVITSNRESGLGRYDVIMEPLNPQENAILIEFKVFDPDEEKNLEETVKRALNQIEEKQYDRYLLDKGFAKNAIRKYGFAFRGKEVLIGE